MAMNGNWLKSLDEIVQMATPWFTERGQVLMDDSGRLLAQQFYAGLNRDYAAKKIQIALGKSVGEVKGQQWQAKMRQFREMEEALIAEGWIWCNDICIPHAGVWEHEALRLSVDRGGGTFPSREDATWAAFHRRLRVRSDEHGYGDGISNAPL